jgi:transposase
MSPREGRDTLSPRERWHEDWQPRQGSLLPTPVKQNLPDSNPNVSTNRATRANRPTTSALQVRKVPCIKLTADVHAGKYQVVRQIGDQPLQPAQAFSPDGFVEFAKKQLSSADKVWCCYEAGPTGFWLQRRLEQFGISCIVAVPGRLDIYNRRINHDRSDARELAGRLSRYVAGESSALAVVRIPSSDAEFRRAAVRQRSQLAKIVRSLAAMGRSFALTQGFRLQGSWWRGKAWANASKLLPAPLIEYLDRYRPVIDQALQAAQSLCRHIVRCDAPTELPAGMGALTFQQIEREVFDWNRFSNRKAPGSFAGLCGGVSASGEQHADLPITKHGSRRLRAILVELAWRMVRFQPNCKAVQRWKSILLTPRVHARRKKQAIVALARQFFVDLWRWRTQRMKPEQFGWIMRSTSLTSD